MLRNLKKAIRTCYVALSSSRPLRPVIDELELAVHRRDAQEAADILRNLNRDDIFSDTDVYDRLEALKGDLGVLLFDGLKTAELGRLVARNQHLDSFDVWESLERVAERVTADTMWELKDYMGFPIERECPRLYATLAAAESEKITEELIATIDRLARAESDEGASLSAHERTMSMFRYVRWNPKDEGLSDCVRLLAARSDEVARAACARYLTELPWGADRLATVALLEGLTTFRASENLSLLRSALSIHAQPAILRTWLWASIGKVRPVESLVGAIEDLDNADNDEDRITFVEHLDSALSQINSRMDSSDRSAIAAAAERVRTIGWSRIVRGYYGKVLQTQLPTANANRVSRRIDRAAIVTARVWEILRPDHIGCGIPFAIMLFMGWLMEFGLDIIMGGPVRVWWVPVVLFWIWIAWAFINMRTHFSGHESLANKVTTSAIYFALLFGWIASSILVRLG